MVLLALSSPASAQHRKRPTLQQSLRRALNSTVKIEVGSADEGAQGSGVIVRPAMGGVYVLSAAHVFDPGESEPISVTFTREDGLEMTYSATLLKTDEHYDLALLFVDDLDQRPIRLARARSRS